MRLLLLSLLSVSMLNVSVATVGPTQIASDVEHIAKIKQTVNKIGSDENVNVTLLDGTTVKGRITVIGDTSFILIRKKTTDSLTINFAQVKQVRRTGSNPLSDPGVWVGMTLIPVIIGFAFWARNKD